MENTNRVVGYKHAVETCDAYREAHKYVTTYEEKKKFYRSELMNNYFIRGEILVSECGIILATAKLQEREEFDVKKFKEEQPELYKQYVVKKTLQPILVK